MRKIEQLFNSGDIEAFREEEETKIRDFLSETEKASGCFKLYSQLLIGKMIQIYLDKKRPGRVNDIFSKVQEHAKQICDIIRAS